MSEPGIFFEAKDDVARLAALIGVARIKDILFLAQAPQYFETRFLRILA